MATTKTALQPVQRNTEERLALQVHRIEQRLTDWGVLAEAGYTEPDTSEIRADLAAAMQSPGAQLAVSCWRGFWRVAAVAALSACVLTLAGCGGGGGDDAEPAPMAPARANQIRAGLVGQPVGTLSPVSLAEAITQDVVISHRPGPPGTLAAAADAARADCEGAQKAARPCVIVSTAIDGQGAQVGKWLAADSMRVTFCDLTRSTALELDTERCAAIALASWRIR
ncbi:hypothetical protein SAMN05421778_11486 [Sphaerotilus natans]|uniref:hypothetical protein n=1 Tax=Sphaerotilus natans TaxID=34103 RepID=UPI0009554FF9|nr:hypothetical protein [Sphaerotilus natans]SIR68406.1 hypothetical protein SAMN05421778_11486 [Sphaerotilus natans]